MMTPQFTQVLVISLLAAAPGLLALYLGYRRAVQRHEEREEARVQSALLRDLQEQTATQQRTIRFLTSQVNELQAARAKEYIETEALRQENEELRNEGRELREEVRELRYGVGELIRQMEAAKITPAWTMPAQAASKRRRERSGVDPVELRKKIAEQFSWDEINDLAFDLKLDPDELTGHTVTSRSRSLVEYVKDRQRLSELVEMCRSKRPDGGF